MSKPNQNRLGQEQRGNTGPVVATFTSPVEMARLITSLGKDAHRNGNGVFASDWLGLTPELGKGEVNPVKVGELLTTGWTRGVSEIEKLMQKIDPLPSRSVRRRPRWGDTGHEVDIHRIWAGNLETAWLGMAKRDGTGPARVTIAIDAIASAFVSAEEMFWRGAAAAVACSLLSGAGYAVRVVSAFTGGSVNASDSDTVCRVIVKDFTEPLNMAALAGAAACPGFFRSIGHVWGYLHLDERFIAPGSGWSVKDLQPASVADLSEGGRLFVFGQEIENEAKAREVIAAAITALQSDEHAALDRAA